MNKAGVINGITFSSAADFETMAAPATEDHSMQDRPDCGIGGEDHNLENVSQDDLDRERDLFGTPPESSMKAELCAVKEDQGPDVEIAMENEEDEDAPCKPHRRLGRRQRRSKHTGSQRSRELDANILDVQAKIQDFGQRCRSILSAGAPKSKPPKRGNRPTKKRSGRTKENREDELKQEATDPKDLPAFNHKDIYQVGHLVYEEKLRSGRLPPPCGPYSVPEEVSETIMTLNHVLTNLLPSERARAPGEHSSDLFISSPLVSIVWTLFSAGKTEEAAMLGHFVIDFCGTKAWQERLAYNMSTDTGINGDDAAAGLDIARAMLQASIKKIEKFDMKSAGYLEAVVGRIGCFESSAESKGLVGIDCH